MTTPEAKTHLHGIDLEALNGVLAPIAHAHGAEVVDIDFKTETGGWVLRISVEKAGSAEKNATTSDAAVDLQLCANVARDLSPALDVADLVPHRYHLEVSSPGVERALKKARDFVRFNGQKAKVKLHSPVNGQKQLVGNISTDQGEKISLTDGGQTFEFTLDNVSSARLVFEFGPAPKPGKQKKSPRAKDIQR